MDYHKTRAEAEEHNRKIREAAKPWPPGFLDAVGVVAKEEQASTISTEWENELHEVLLTLDFGKVRGFVAGLIAKAETDAKRERIVLICDGGDWTDASFDDLMVPEDMDLEEEKKLWRSWYEGEYLPELHAERKPKFRSLVDFLCEKGAREANLEQFWDI